MKIIVALITFFTIIGQANACCGANQHSIYLLGSSKKKLVVAEIKVFRYCKQGMGAGKLNQFYWRGVVNLGYYQNDSVTFIQNIDSIDFQECRCTSGQRDSLSNYIDSLQPYLDQAYELAHQLPTFEEAVPLDYKYNSKNDSIEHLSFVNDSTLGYNGKVIPLSQVHWGACGELIHINDIRSYQLKSKTFTLVNISCSSSFISEQRQKNNQELFTDKRITYDGIAWHGSQKSILLRGNLLLTE